MTSSAKTTGGQGECLFLIGFSGSGKSTVGPLLARAMGRRFVDLDSLIERKTSRSISDIFASDGEPHFRELEESTLSDLLISSNRKMVVALGGGAFQRPAIRRLAQAHGLVVYLSCSRETIYRRMRDKVDRPLLQVKPSGNRTVRQERLRRIRELLERRRRNYHKADLTVSTTSRTPHQAVREIVRRWRARKA